MFAARLRTALLLSCLAACGSGRPGVSVRETDTRRDYLRLAVALGERDPDALDYYFGPPGWVADVRVRTPSLSQIRESAAHSEERARAAGDRFLAGQLHAVAARAALLLAVKKDPDRLPLSFDEEAEALFGIRLLPPDLHANDAVRGNLARRLPGAGTLAARYDALERKFMIPPERLPGVMERALAECRDRTRAHLTLPAGEQVTLQYVYNQPWSAYSTYLGNYRSLIRVSADLGLTVDRALQLACHEGYPGHHVFNVLTDELLVRGGKHTELYAQPTFSPQSFVYETTAESAPDLAFSAEERLRFESEVLFPLAGIGVRDAAQYLEIEKQVARLHNEELAIARDYLGGRLEFARAAQALEARALMAHPEATLRYLNEFRSYVVTYTSGRDTTAAWLTAQSGDRWQALLNLIRTQEGFPMRKL